MRRPSSQRIVLDAGQLGSEPDRSALDGCGKSGGFLETILSFGLPARYAARFPLLRWLQLGELARLHRREWE